MRSPGADPSSYASICWLNKKKSPTSLGWLESIDGCRVPRKAGSLPWRLPAAFLIPRAFGSRAGPCFRLPETPRPEGQGSGAGKTSWEYPKSPGISKMGQEKPAAWGKEISAGSLARQENSHQPSYPRARDAPFAFTSSQSYPCGCSSVPGTKQQHGSVPLHPKASWHIKTHPSLAAAAPGRLRGHFHRERETQAPAVQSQSPGSKVWEGFGGDFTLL